MAKNDNINEAYLQLIAKKSGIDYNSLSRKEKSQFAKSVEQQIVKAGYDPSTINKSQLNQAAQEIDYGQVERDWYKFTGKITPKEKFKPEVLFKKQLADLGEENNFLLESDFYKDVAGKEFASDMNRQIMDDLARESLQDNRVVSGKDFEERGKWPYEESYRSKPKVRQAREIPQLKTNVALTDDENVIKGDSERTGGTSGTGGTGGTGDTRTPEQIRQSAEQKLNDAYLGSSDMTALQSSYSAYTDLEELPRFQFDDTYAPDSEGYRDIPGYLLDAARGTIGAFGATKPLEEYTPSSDFQLMGQEARSRRDLGLDQETKSLMTDQMDRAYNYDVTNIRNMSGGSGGVALANLGGASARYNDAAANMGALDAQIKAQNRQDFYNAARAGEAVNRQIFEDQRAIDMLDKQAGGALLSDSIDSIQHRKEYEDTYKKPGSPYYEYMKELTLGNRMNRDLMEFGEEQNMARYARTLLSNENQLQEEIAERERGRRNTIEQFKKKAEEEGYATSPQTAEEFDSYDGQPIVDINQPLSDQEMFASLNDPSQFGISQADMSQMSDEALAEQGIERVPKTRTRTKADGTTEEIKYFDYNLREEMDADSDENIELSRIEDNINREYSQKKQALMEELYLKDEKEYNKRLKALEEEEKQAIKSAAKYKQSNNKAFTPKNN
jgi:hypothetical protein